MTIRKNNYYGLSGFYYSEIDEDLKKELSMLLFVAPQIGCAKAKEIADHTNSNEKALSLIKKISQSISAYRIATFEEAIILKAKNWLEINGLVLLTEIMELGLFDNDYFDDWESYPEYLVKKINKIKFQNKSQIIDFSEEYEEYISEEAW